jgi:hypothetical protein
MSEKSNRASKMSENIVKGQNPLKRDESDFFRRWKESEFVMPFLSCIQFSRLRHLPSNVQTAY